MSESTASVQDIAGILDDVATGEFTLSGQLSLISEMCQGVSLAHPEINEVYQRFERARQDVRFAPSEANWEEVKASATALAEALRLL
jgi:hypothetical protein